MIGRYTRPAMGKIWTNENKFSIWREIEILACEAQADLANQASLKRKPHGLERMQILLLSALMKLKK